MTDLRAMFGLDNLPLVDPHHEDTPPEITCAAARSDRLRRTPALQRPEQDPEQDRPEDGPGHPGR